MDVNPSRPDSKDMAITLKVQSIELLLYIIETLSLLKKDKILITDASF